MKCLCYFQTYWAYYIIVQCIEKHISMCDTTVDVERFAGLNIRGFSLWSFSRKYFHGALATSVHYLPKVKNSQENFRGKLKNHGNGKRLAQRIFSCLRNNFIKLDSLTSKWHTGFQIIKVLVYCTISLSTIVLNSRDR